MLDAVVFDYNSTLIDDLDLAVESYHRAGRDLGHPVDRGTVRQHMSQPPSRKRTLYFGAIGDAEWQAIIARRKAVYSELARTRYRLFPRTEEVLTRLSGRYRLGLLSNTFRDLYEALFPAHLKRLFQASLFFDEVPDPKPSPAPMVTMLGRLGVDRRACGYVGDAVEDVQMALAAGVRSFALPTGACSAEELRAAGAGWVGPDLGALAACLLNGADSENA
jgi:HAD superfamily hydrolase (TIGR01549 family)